MAKATAGIGAVSGLSTGWVVSDIGFDAGRLACDAVSASDVAPRGPCLADDGAPTRLRYTVLGDPVNLASRLEAANTWYGTSVLVSDATRATAGDGFAWRRVGMIRVKSRSEPEIIHELLGAASEIDDDLRVWAAGYESAFDRYRDRAFAEAIERLNDFAARRPDDRSALWLRDRCEELNRTPPPDDWDGVATYSRKTL